MTAINRSITEPHCRGRGLLLTVAGAAMLASFPLCTSASAAVVDNATTLDNATALGNMPTLGNAPALSSAAGAPLDNPPSSGAHTDYLLANVMPVSDAELSKNRGGFSIGDLNVSFGFSVRTAIRGPHMQPFVVTNNFTVDHPGHVRHLGSQVSYGSSSNGPVSNGNSPTNGFSVNVASNTPNNSDNSNPGPTSPPNNQNLPSTVHTNVLASNTVTSQPTTTKTPAATIPPVPQSDFNVVTTPHGSPSVHVDTSNGILTTIKNDVNGLTFTSQVDLNYAVNNYHAIVSNARSFVRAANMADQMLALHGLGR